jgi:hypothetical protein
LKKKPKPGQTDRFRFDSVFLGKKPVQTGFLGFFGFGSVFSGFGSVFFGLARFWLGFFGLARFFVGFGSVRFFQFFVYKTEPNRFFFQKFNRFFFRLFFFRLSRFNQFSGFFAYPYQVI